MAGQGRWRRWLGSAGLALSLGASGCMSGLHRMDLPENAPPCAACADSQEIPRWKTIPDCSKKQVRIFFMQSLDPLDCANLTGVREYVQSLGFIKTYSGEIYHASHFIKEIRRLHQEEPETRFVLVGYAAGAGKVQDIARAVAPDGIHIDLLVYLDGAGLGKEPAAPENVSRVINIRAECWTGKNSNLEGAVNIAYPKESFFGSPTHPFTLELLADELTSIAAMIPVVYMDCPPLMGATPTPRPVIPPKTGERDDWDFLKPEPMIVPPSGLPQMPRVPEGETSLKEEELPAPRKLNE